MKILIKSNNYSPTSSNEMPLPLKMNTDIVTNLACLIESHFLTGQFG